MLKSISSARWFAAPFFRWSTGIVLAIVVGLLVLESLGISVFRRIGMPHEYCYLMDPKLIWLHVTSDLLIGVAYVSISCTLGYLVYRASRGIPFNWIFLAFGLFIVSCGFTHFMEVWVIWEPVYWLSGYVKVVTAAASVATALALFPLMPKVFKLVEAARQGERRRLEIEQLNQDLERFNYSVAHDLRAPLRSISAFSQMLVTDHQQQLSAEAQDYLKRIQRSVGKMDTMITDLLRYATIGRQEIVREPVALDPVLRSALASLEAEIRTSGGEVVTTTALPVVAGDPTLLHVIFQNLIGNALKFVSPGTRPRVEISASVQAGRATIAFVDNGMGIPENARERIFGMFERMHPEKPGTGIGLPIVQRAVERLQGRIGVRPAPARTGTEFWIELSVSG